MKRTAIIAGTVVVILLAASTPGSAQGVGGRHDVRAFQVRLGGFFPAGGDDLWNDDEEVFTLDISDFNDLVLGFSFVVAQSNRLEVGFNADFYDSNAVSEYRDCYHEPCLSAFHDTRLETLPLTVDVRFLPFGRHRIRHGGRNVLQPVFYVGGGLGVNVWEYTEDGEFFDFEDPEIPTVFGRLKDSGAALETHAVAGIELPMGPRTNLLFEGRYSWSDDNLGGDFNGFGTIELGGGSVYVGGSFLF